MLKGQIGRRLKELRKERGFTQKALAAKVKNGIDYTYIGKMERGEQLPSLKVLTGLADALSVHISHFFLEEATLRLLRVIPGEARRIVKNERLWGLLRSLEGVVEEDIPLLTEIVKVLNAHRRSREGVLKVAEEPEGYKRRKGG